MVHGKKERRITRIKRIRKRIIIRNGAKTISLKTLFGRLNDQDVVGFEHLLQSEILPNKYPVMTI